MMVGREGFDKPDGIRLGRMLCARQGERQGRRESAFGQHITFNQLVNMEFNQENRYREMMVGREGFEPSTNWLKASCSTN